MWSDSNSDDEGGRGSGSGRGRTFAEAIAGSKTVVAARDRLPPK
jgi:hypothetical protein